MVLSVSDEVGAGGQEMPMQLPPRPQHPLRGGLGRAEAQLAQALKPSLCSASQLLPSWLVPARGSR